MISYVEKENKSSRGEGFTNEERMSENSKRKVRKKRNDEMVD